MHLFRSDSCNETMLNNGSTQSLNQAAASTNSLNNTNNVNLMTSVPPTSLQLNNNINRKSSMRCAIVRPMVDVKPQQQQQHHLLMQQQQFIQQQNLNSQRNPNNISPISAVTAHLAVAVSTISNEYANNQNSVTIQAAAAAAAAAAANQRNPYMIDLT